MDASFGHDSPEERVRAERASSAAKQVHMVSGFECVPAADGLYPTRRMT